MDVKILSIQSHVVSGTVGNKAAIFPLQLLGFDVDFINTVHFSNHTGYSVIKGTVMTGDQLKDIAYGLNENNLLTHDYVLTGYIGSQTFLDSVLELLLLIKNNNNSMKYICDPVLGDDGKCYVPKELIPIFAEKIVSKAYMITPNQFEAELLTNKIIKNHNDVLNILIDLHKLGPKIVVLTSAIIDDISAGQYAMIKSVPPGESNVKYQFVAAISQDPKKEALPGITFFKTKAVSYPGGDKFKPLDDCEIDPRSCDIDDE